MKVILLGSVKNKPLIRDLLRPKVSFMRKIYFKNYFLRINKTKNMLQSRLTEYFLKNAWNLYQLTDVI